MWICANLKILSCNRIFGKCFCRFYQYGNKFIPNTSPVKIISQPFPLSGIGTRQHAVLSDKINTENLCVIAFYILTISFLYLIKIEIVCALHTKWTNSFRLKIKHDGYYQFMWRNYANLLVSLKLSIFNSYLYQ